MADKEMDKVPRIALDREDIAQRRGASAPRPSAAASNQMTMILLAALAIVALGGLAFLFLQLQKYQQELQSARSRIDQLEQRLSSTDTSMTQSTVLLASRLKDMDDASMANKNDIHRMSGILDRNGKSLDANATDIKSLQAAVKDMQPQLQQAVTQAATNTAQLKTIDSTEKETAQRVEVVEESVSSVEADTKALKEQQQKQDKRVATLEDTARSTDVFRRNTQEELRRLQDGMMKLLPAAAPAATPAPAPASKPASN